MFSYYLILLIPLFGCQAYWQMDWSDEFIGDSIDYTKWKVINEDAKCDANLNDYLIPYQQLDCKTNNSRNLWLSNGFLSIAAVEEKYLSKNFTSAMIITKKSFTFGRFQIKAALPKGKFLKEVIHLILTRNTGDKSWIKNVNDVHIDFNISEPKQIIFPHIYVFKKRSERSDIFVSHNTWITFAFMVRIVKRYNFNYRDISAKSISFSSYPGIILSFDDFYLMSSGLTAMETTNFNFNSSLWKYVVPDQIVLGFLRITVANRLASSGKEWTQIFSKYNSGTYNTQWMITDMKKFEKGVYPSNLSNDLLWGLEQMPGHIEAADKTEVLRTQHYWPSYNIPYFQTIYDLSAAGTFAQKYGDFFTYNNTPRARIFKRDHKKVTNSSTLYKLMRYNDFKNDPLSRCDECNPPYSAKYTIAARCDLEDPKGHYPNPILGFKSQAAIDTKLTNSEMFKNLELIANNGPTYDSQPPFQWSTTKLFGVRHFGQLDLFKFPPVHVKWSPADQIPVNL